MNKPLSRRRYSKESQPSENLISSQQWSSNQTATSYSEPVTGNVKMFNIQSQTQQSNLSGAVMPQWDQASQGNTLLQPMSSHSSVPHHSNPWQNITTQSSNVDPWNWDIEGSQGNSAIHQSGFIPSVQNWQHHDAFHNQPQQNVTSQVPSETTIKNPWTGVNQSQQPLGNVNEQHGWNYQQQYSTESTSNNNSYNWHVEQSYNRNEYNQWYGHQKPIVNPLPLQNQDEKLENTNTNQFASNPSWDWEKNWTNLSNLETSKEQVMNQMSQVIPEGQLDSENCSASESVINESKSEVQNCKNSVNISSEVSENGMVKHSDSSDCNKGLSAFFNNDNTFVDCSVPTTEASYVNNEKDNSLQEKNQNNIIGDKIQDIRLKKEENSQLINDDRLNVKELDSSSNDDDDETSTINKRMENLSLNSSLKEREIFPIEEPVNQEVPEPSADMPQIETNSSQRQRGVGNDSKNDNTSIYRNTDEPINQQIPDIVPVFPPQSNTDTCRNNSADIIQQERGTVIKPREGSPFKPPSKSFSSGNVIQQEIEQNILEDTIPISTAQEVNLETLPENLEHPPDGEMLSHQSSWHASLHRHHNHPRCNNSPSTTLWDNPDLPSVTFVPAAPLLTENKSEKGSNINQSIEADSLESNVNTVSRQSPLGWEGYQTDVKKQASVPISAAEQVVSDMITNHDTLTLGPPQTPVSTMELLHRTSPQGAGHNQQQNKSLPDKSKSEISYSQHDENRINAQLTGETGKSRYDDLASSGRMQRQDIERFSTQRVVSGHGSVSDREILRDRKDDLSQKRDSLPNQSLVNEEQIGRWDRNYGNRRHEDERRRGHYPSEIDRSNRNEVWDRRLDSRYYPDDKRYNSLDERDYYSERDRSRPSSRTSLNESIDGQERFYRDRDYRRTYYQDRIRTPTSESERGNWPNDRKYYRNNGYDRDIVYNDRYASYRRNEDPYRSGMYTGYNYDLYRQDPHAYYRYYDHLYKYGYNNYNFGYYDELYRNDPRYQAQLDERYQEYYAQMARETDYERVSVHSGRSSVNDELQRERQNRFVGELDQSSVGGSDYSNYQHSYGADYTNSTNITDREQTVTSRLTPTKFSCPHPVACFSPGGLLITVFPNLTETVGSSALQIHSVQELFPSEDECIKELQIFPGPLQRGKTHKNDIIQFCQKKIQQLKTKEVTDRESCILLWELMIRLLRQNGCVAGIDVAELLLNNHEVLNPLSKRSNDVTQADGILSDISESTKQISTGDTPSPDEGIVVTHDRTVLNSSDSMNREKVTQKFREFLLFGGKQDALEWAMKHNLWGHALFLASKMDSHNYANVMKRFANSLAPNDPLQTLYQLMSGRQPASVTRVADEKWGDWRPHLAMILSNPSSRIEVDLRSITTLGDTLASLGCLSAAHFCYLMAQLEFGSYSNKSSKLVLLGSSNLLPFQSFASNEAIQCTEIYEYAQSLANPDYLLPHLQAYKFIYATRLVEYGFPQEALHYCETISQTFHKLNGYISSNLINQVYNLANKLKYHDPHFTQGQGELEELGDPNWLINLQRLCTYKNEISSSFELNNISSVTNFNDTVNRSQFITNNSELEQTNRSLSDDSNFSQQQIQIWEKENNNNNQSETQPYTNIQESNNQMNNEQQYHYSYNSQWSPEKINVEEKASLGGSMETTTTELSSQQNISTVDYYSASIQQEYPLSVSSASQSQREAIPSQGQVNNNPSSSEEHENLIKKEESESDTAFCSSAHSTPSHTYLISKYDFSTDEKQTLVPNHHKSNNKVLNSCLKSNKQSFKEKNKKSIKFDMTNVNFKQGSSEKGKLRQAVLRRRRMITRSPLKGNSTDSSTEGSPNLTVTKKKSSLLSALGLIKSNLQEKKYSERKTKKKGLESFLKSNQGSKTFAIDEPCNPEKNEMKVTRKKIWHQKSDFSSVLKNKFASYSDKSSDTERSSDIQVNTNTVKKKKRPPLVFGGTFPIDEPCNSTKDNISKNEICSSQNKLSSMSRKPRAKSARQRNRQTYPIDAPCCSKLNLCPDHANLIYEKNMKSHSGSCSSIQSDDDLNMSPIHSLSRKYKNNQIYQKPKIQHSILVQKIVNQPKSSEKNNNKGDQMTSIMKDEKKSFIVTPSNSVVTSRQQFNNLNNRWERRDSNVSNHSGGYQSNIKQTTNQYQPPNQSTTDSNKKSEKKEGKEKTQVGRSWLGGIFSKFLPKAPNQMILPDDKNPAIVWDSTKNCWVNTDETEDNESGKFAPPPKDSDLLKEEKEETSRKTFPYTSGQNKFQRPKVRGMRQNYVDVLNPNTNRNNSLQSENLGKLEEKPLPPPLLVPQPVALPENEIPSPPPLPDDSYQSEKPVEAIGPSPMMFDPAEFATSRSGANVPRSERLNRRAFLTR